MLPPGGCKREGYGVLSDLSCQVAFPGEGGGAHLSIISNQMSELCILTFHKDFFENAKPFPNQRFVEPSFIWFMLELFFSTDFQIFRFSEFILTPPRFYIFYNRLCPPSPIVGLTFIFIRRVKPCFDGACGWRLKTESEESPTDSKDTSHDTVPRGGLSFPLSRLSTSRFFDKRVRKPDLINILHHSRDSKRSVKRSKATKRK